MRLRPLQNGGLIKPLEPLGYMPGEFELFKHLHTYSLPILDSSHVRFTI